MKLLYLLAVTFCLTQAQHAFARTTDAPDLPPPALVECKTEATCDTNPQHLEKFVADFYKWYAASSEFTFSPSLHKLPRDVFKKRKLEHNKEQDNILKERITPDFYTWIHTIDPNYGDRPETFRYCSEDINYITCTQDIFDEWIYTTKAQFLVGDTKLAIFIVYLATPQQKSGKPNLPYLISVRLEVIGGTWRIAGTTLLSY